MSNPAEQHDDTPEAGNVLRIVAGLHAGASRVLGDNEMILVGSGDDCDIVLADAGVASHHALISVVGGRNTLRALDAPVRVDSQVVHPGDPIELSAVQRIGLGGAALAFGAEQDAAWSTLLPTGQVAAARTPHPFTRRLPLIAAVAALSLVSVAIFAAVMPAQAPQVDVAGQLNSMIAKHQVRDGRAHVEDNGTGVLSGTVRDAGTRDAIRKELQEQGIVASLDLRTGDDIATDVREVLRTQGITAKTRFLPTGDVEVAGRFEDAEALQAAVRSRAMLAVRGVNKVRLANYAPPPKPAASATAAAPLGHGQRADVVNIVRGKEPHIVTLDGGRFPPGADLPDGRKLIAIGERGAWATLPDGSLEQVKVITASEIAARREAEAAARGPSQAGNPAAMQQAAIERAGTTTQASNRAALEATAPKAPAASPTRL